MSPIRKTDDFRAVEIDSWDEYIQEEITGMHVRGEFENLPDQGKPIKIWKTDVDPEKDLAFSRLKNAGVLPLWMELDQKIGRTTDELWARLDAVEVNLRALLSQATQDDEPVSEPDLSRWERLRRWFRIDLSDDAPSPPTITEVMALRERERRRFLDHAAELDKLISNFNDSLPKGGEHLQRFRWLPDRAARAFDERVTLMEWWAEVQPEHI